VRLLRQPVHERRPVLDAVISNAQQADMRGRAEQTLLEVLAKSIVDRQSNDQRRDPCGNSHDRDTGNDADKGLPSLGAKVSGCDEEFETHAEAISRQLSAFSQIGLYVMHNFIPPRVTCGIGNKPSTEMVHRYRNKNGPYNATRVR
jgi:hypothetical protein